MRLVHAVSLLALALPLHLHAAAGPACASGLRLNEILAGPARDWDGNGVFSSRDDEWVELVNTGGEMLELAGFLLTDGDSIPRYAMSGTLPAGGRRVVFGRDAYEWEKANGYPAFGLSLNNAGDSVLLWRVAGADTQLVDAYAYKSHEAGADRSIGRFPDGGGAWTLFDGLNPYTGTLQPKGNGCAPTPDLANQCGGTPAAPTSWGRLKALYR